LPAFGEEGYDEFWSRCYPAVETSLPVCGECAESHMLDQGLCVDLLTLFNSDCSDTDPWKAVDGTCGANCPAN